jgi:hypothetical protein
VKTPKDHIFSTLSLFEAQIRLDDIQNNSWHSYAILAPFNIRAKGTGHSSTSFASITIRRKNHKLFFRPLYGKAIAVLPKRYNDGNEENAERPGIICTLLFNEGLSVGIKRRHECIDFFAI